MSARTHPIHTRMVLLGMPYLYQNGDFDFPMEMVGVGLHRGEDCRCGLPHKAILADEAEFCNRFGFVPTYTVEDFVREIKTLKDNYPNSRIMSQLSLFPEAATPPRKTKKKESYDEFVDKFKPKLTTDDCYTPPAVYDVVLAWVCRNCDIEGCNIIRPFYPGGDFEAVDYGPHDVVVDNPPFSIITKIVRWYTERGIRFFLFAPYLTCFQPGRFCSALVTNTPIVYENGEEVNTSFVTNMLGDIRAMSAPDLAQELEAVQTQGKKTLPKYTYPDHVIRATDLGRYARRGIRFIIPKEEAHFITNLDNQRGQTGIFGGGYLLSDRLAAAKRAAHRLPAARLPAAAAPEQEPIEWALAERERRIIAEELNKST